MAKKPDWLYSQSAVLPIHGESVVLITTRKRKRWIIPKGVVERGMEPHESAAKEAFEEAGVTGHVEEQEIGTYQYKKWGGVCTVQVYVLTVTKVHDEWMEYEMRERRFVSTSEALELIEIPALREIVQRYFDSEM